MAAAGPKQAVSQVHVASGFPPAAAPPVAPLPPVIAPSASGAPTTGQPAATAGAKVDHLQMARNAFDLRDWPRALAEGKSAVDAGGGAEAHALLGSTYFKMGRFDDAERSYARAAALDPKSSLLQDRLRIARARAEQSKTSK